MMLGDDIPLKVLRSLPCFDELVRKLGSLPGFEFVNEIQEKDIERMLIQEEIEDESPVQRVNLPLDKLIKGKSMILEMSRVADLHKLNDSTLHLAVAFLQDCLGSSEFRQEEQDELLWKGCLTIAAKHRGTPVTILNEKESPRFRALKTRMLEVIHVLDRSTAADLVQRILEFMEVKGDSSLQESISRFIRPIILSNVKVSRSVAPMAIYHGIKTTADQESLYKKLEDCTGYTSSSLSSGVETLLEAPFFHVNPGR